MKLKKYETDADYIFDLVETVEDEEGKPQEGELIRTFTWGKKDNRMSVRQMVREIRGILTAEKARARRPLGADETL